mmetsp:Transcript_9169/g.22561  ORF Transcript_9169/g.22561 Transcript_9169/m.22561 type:complete len:643 (+) Transcript_9169:361-2289(+)|eukprot:CAMPEP_0180124874 /NCGR_PEP_ID=MMETSP0986-20121125/4883_1 /TAXON_ID=697907 /ORGANISM="non described non described, Strain CCMP2293" /LENGTH=642 /DNA_ID=CAMNT_0022064241 /DNA_START=358 /DNA_END=2286 /DNA_ORIENTATION=+
MPKKGEKLEEVKWPAIGIDLGSTHACVAIWQNNKAEIIPNDAGVPKTPCVVAFTQTTELVGDAANHPDLEPETLVVEVKRLMGKQLDDPAVGPDVNKGYFPFRVVAQDGGRAFVEIKRSGRTRSVAPQEISSMIIKKLKESAESFLSKEVKYCVITVPSYFDEAGRTATKEAGQKAGLEVLRVINEPTAAGIAYGLERPGALGAGSSGHVLVYDLGGGTCDLTLLKVEDGVFEVKGAGGDTNFGGNDLDKLLLGHCMEEFKRAHGVVPTDETPDGRRALRRFLAKCEQAKRVLSTTAQTTIEIDQVYGGVDFYTNITRSTFENLCEKFLRSTLDALERLLREAKLSKNQIDKVVLAGGSTRIPRVVMMLQDFFSGVDVRKTMPPEQVVAAGAALQAAIIAGVDSEKTDDSVMFDLAPLNIGLETHGGIMTGIIKRGEALPRKNVEMKLCTVTDDQEAVLVQIYEGARPMAKDNRLLGRILLDGIPRKPRGQEVSVVFSLEKSGTLTVAVKNSGTSESLTISNDKGREADLVERAIKDASHNREADEGLKGPIESRNSLESYSHWMLTELKKQLATKSSGGERTTQLLEQVEEIVVWLNANRTAELKDTEPRKRTLDEVRLVMSKLQREGAANAGADKPEVVD